MGKPRPHLVREHEQAEVAAQLSVVALLRQLQPLQVLLQHLLLGEADAVDARELRPRLVAAPVRPGEGQELDGLDWLRARDVRAAAQVRELALRVEGDGPVVEALQELQLVRVALVREVGDGLVSWAPRGARTVLSERASSVIFFSIAGKSSDERADMVGLRQVDVVVEPVLDGRSDPQTDARVQRLQGLGQEVRRRVPEGGLPALGLPRQDRDRGAVRQRPVEVADLAVHFDGEGGRGRGPSRWPRQGRGRSRRRGARACCRRGA